MIAEIITVGTELLLGSLVDTNSALLGRRLAEIGVDVHFKSSVGDNTGRLEKVLRLALGRSDVVITSGGLGPTVDDLTRTALARVAERELKTDSRIAAALRAFFKKRGRPLTPNNLAQAQVPKGALALPNPNGTAPGLWIPCLGPFEGKILVALPGPPRELGPMLEASVLPKLARRLDGSATIKTVSLLTFGLGESAVDQAIRDLFEKSRNPSVAMLAHPTHVEIRLTAKAATLARASAMIEPLKKKILKRVGGHVFSQEGKNLEKVVGDLLLRKKTSLALAESCTGGLIASRVTSVPGSSAYFKESLVTYADAAKQELLGVPPALLKKFGAVSRETSLAMVQGLARVSRCGVCLSVTGIAGPGGGSKIKPVGLVHYAVKSRHGLWHQEYRFGPGHRTVIQARAAQAGLYLVYRALMGKRPAEAGLDRGTAVGNETNG